jgi:hypothetical protein
VITVSDTARAALSGSWTYYLNVQSWLGDQLLATNVPVDAGSEETDRSLRVPERVTLTVPKKAAGTDWTPTAATSPLAANGQTLKISLGIGKGPDGIEWFQRGEYLIHETKEGDDGLTLAVTAVGLLALIDEAKFIAPFQPTGTFRETVRSLVEPALTVDVSAAPTDRSAGSVGAFDTDRLAGLYELIDAWPAASRMNAGGYLEIIPDVAPTAADVVRTFSTAAGGTVIVASGESTREGAFSAVLVTGYAADGTEVRGVRYVPSGPWAYPAGAANPLPVPWTFASPFMTSQQICSAVAEVLLRRKVREAISQRYEITAVPDPTLEIGDVVTITTDHVTDLLCTVERISLPYFPTGPMGVTVASVS